MFDQVYDLSQYVEGLRRITCEETDDKKILQRVAPLAQKFAATPGLIKDEFYDCDEEQGFSVYLLHEEEGPQQRRVRARLASGSRHAGTQS